MKPQIAPANLKASPALTPHEAAQVQAAALSRSPSFWRRFRYGMEHALKVVSKEEFNRICVQVHADINGAVGHPEEIAKKAKRMIEAYTLAEATVFVPKCDLSDNAILVAWLGRPNEGFLFQRAFTLKDPKGAKRG